MMKLIRNCTIFGNSVHDLIRGEISVTLEDDEY